MQRIQRFLHTHTTVVVKIGTNLLADKATGINLQRVDAIARNVAQLRAQGHHVAIVSSGAIGAGVAALKMKQRPRTIPEKQAVASIGQPLLMEAYVNAFRRHDQTISQILLTKDDFATRRRFVNARNTFTALLRRGIVPIINENDTVAVEEIKLGDNDNLSAMVANLIEADALIILSDIDGLFSDDPSRNPDAELVPIVERITPAIERLAKGARSELSTGGMATKIQAAKRCVNSGIAMIIANGRSADILRDIFSGSFTGTLFLPSKRSLSVKKKWIGFVAHAKGSIIVDEGAKLALIRKNKSLLPSGVTDVQGTFSAGDTVSVRDTAGQEIARGVSAFSSRDICLIRGKKSAEAGRLLGRAAAEEVIHKDNLVVIGEK
ncbi:MAG: glutamate 5-kinase [Acidobacteriota bacterium]